MLTLSLVAALFAPPAELIRYANATSDLGLFADVDTHAATRLFDGDDKTFYCEGVEGMGREERIGLELTRPIVAGRIRIAAGDSVSAGFEPANRPRAITISNLTYTWQILMPDSAEPFELPLPPPFKGQQVIIRFDEIYDHRARHTCLAELTLFEGDTPVGLVPVAKAVRPAAGKPTWEGVWAPIGAPDPEDFLVFYRDGGFKRIVDPNTDARKAEQNVGTWSRAGAALTYKTNDGTTRTAKAQYKVGPETRPLLLLEGAWGGMWRPYVPTVGY